MTRISSGVLPIELCDSQLLAEHREILRIPNAIKYGTAKVNIDKLPSTFRLGTGHVKFFYNKLLYLRRRYDQLYIECKRRKFNVKYCISSFENLPEELFNDWQPDAEVRSIVQKRIADRLSAMKKIRYCSENTTSSELSFISNAHKRKVLTGGYVELI